MLLCVCVCVCAASKSGGEAWQTIIQTLATDSIAEYAKCWKNMVCMCVKRLATWWSQTQPIKCKPNAAAAFFFISLFQQQFMFWWPQSAEGSLALNEFMDGRRNVSPETEVNGSAGSSWGRQVGKTTRKQHQHSFEENRLLMHKLLAGGLQSRCSHLSVFSLRRCSESQEANCTRSAMGGLQIGAWNLLWNGHVRHRHQHRWRFSFSCGDTYGRSHLIATTCWRTELVNQKIVLSALVRPFNELPLSNSRQSLGKI